MVIFRTHPLVSEPMLTPWPLRKLFRSARTFTVDMFTMRPLQSLPALRSVESAGEERSRRKEAVKSDTTHSVGN